MNSSSGGRLNRITVAEEDLIQFAVKFTGTCVCNFLLVLALIIPLAMAVMGCLYLDDCPAEDNIPIYLIVAGVVSIIFVLGRYISTMESREYLTLLSLFQVGWFITGKNVTPSIVQEVIPDPIIQISCATGLDQVLNPCGYRARYALRQIAVTSRRIFIRAVSGSVWIFSIYEPSYDKNSSDDLYCHKHLYLFAFWITIAEYIMIVVMIVYLCILCRLAENAEN